MRIGVLGIQGDVSEHAESAKRALEHYGIDGSVEIVRKRDRIGNLDFLIIPGGESTTISRLMVKSGIYHEILKYAEDTLSVIGTCAGSILMAKKILDDDRVKPLGLMNMSVRRNFFGRQRESFETELDIKGIGKYHAVFIRAPVIESCSGSCEVLATVGNKIAMAREGRNYSLIFHPELTDDYRIYRLLFKI